MKNKFFDTALWSASRLAGKKGRIAILAGTLAYKISTVPWKNVDKNSVKDKFLLVGRLIKAYVTGKYRGIEWKSLLVLLAAVIYFVNPIDLIPDVVPMLGLTDDFAVLLWVYNSLAKEIDKFIAWEATQ